ncbi:MAG: hypothetical protein KDD55_01690 [Bdellovibrionales bacterium]|nr:hypothetical protein [Bdellovibrionales bacterium]
MKESTQLPSELKKGILTSLLLIAILTTLELTLGAAFRRQDESRSASQDLQNPLTYYRAPAGVLPLPQKKEGTHRILYLSNSHARTGGYVSKHLQQLLDTIEPQSYEVLDFSDPGIFAPDMLQRFLEASTWKPDLLLLPVAYISFSDRMQLRRQSFSARSFFRPSIFSSLPLGFWLRNYDIGLFADKATETASSLLGHKKEIRALWQKPLSRFLHSLFGPLPIRFLEVDESQSWKFPKGFDQNLFNWRLYAQGRSGHLADFQSLIDIAKERNIPTLAFNLPIHWEKDPHKRYQEDIVRYEQDLKVHSKNATQYINYENSFPKQFTTYDALHPTWHGARLHAFDLLLRLIEHNFVLFSQEDALKAFHETGRISDEQYDSALSGKYPPLLEVPYIRVDLFDPDIAHELLQLIASIQPGSPDEQNYLRAYSRRIRYWTESTFSCGPLWEKSGFEQAWLTACKQEQLSAIKRISLFQQKLGMLQGQRLARYPIFLPTLHEKPIEEKEIRIRNHTIVQSQYQRDGIFYFLYTTQQNLRPFAFTTQSSKNNPPYLRVDLLGDGSFSYLSHPRKFFIPDWALGKAVKIDWGT